MGRAGMIAALALAVVVPAFAEGVSGPSPARYRVGGVEIGGLPDEPDVPDAILMSIPLYYSADAVRRVVEALSRLLSDNGYPYNRIFTEVVKDSAQCVVADSVSAIGAAVSDTSITIYLTVDHGERVCAGRPLIIGSRGSKKFFYYDVGFVPEKFYSGRDVDEAVLRLSLRPYVERASAMSPVIIEDAPLCRDSLRGAVVAISVTERSAVEVEGALGYESGRGSESGKLRGQLGLSFVNLLGRGESADVSYVGSRAAQRLKLSAAVPWVFDLPVAAGVSFGAEVEDGGYGFFGGEVSGSVESAGRYRWGAALNASETVPPDSVGYSSYTYYGVDVFFGLAMSPLERGALVPEFSLRAGSGAAYREKSYLRGRAEAAIGVHYPVYGACALLGRVCAKSLFTDEGYLSPAELYRMGGHGSLRGYSEDEFAFRSAMFSQAEFLYYFSGASSVYAFVDGGVGFDAPGPLSMSGAKKLLGYGLGIRFPSRLGAVELEWARNASDGLSLGRVHVGVRAGME